MTRPTRRALLGAVASGLVGVAGCQSRGGGLSGPDRTPFDVPSSSASDSGGGGSSAGPAPSCSGVTTSFDPPWLVTYDEPIAGFAFVMRDSRIGLGDSLLARLKNVSDRPRETAGRGAFDVQYRSPDGWHTVFGLAGRSAPADETTVPRRPGQTFDWQFRFSTDGLAGLAREAETPYGLCGPVTPGIYRFVYYGLDPDGDRDVDALGSRFRVAGR